MAKLEIAAETYGPKLCERNPLSCCAITRIRLLPTPFHSPPSESLLEMCRAALDDEMHVDIGKMQHRQSRPDLRLLEEDDVKSTILTLVRMEALIESLLPI